MRLFKWGSAHAVYIPEFDAEHRTLFRMADELQQAIATRASTSRVRLLLRSLIAYMEDHFAHEERVMRTFAFPSYAWHKQQHDTVRKRARHFVKLLDEGHHETTMELLEFLSVWLKGHTGLTDRMMGAYLRNRERLQSTLAS